MTLKDVSNGPDWIIWIVFAAFAVISIILLSGHGANMIAGYNSAGKEEKNRFNEKKLCRVVGGGLSVITVLIFIMAIGESVLPASFSNVFIVVVVVDCAAIIVLSNTVCRR
ncbi:MAG: DUF3784 domain-containing protein [Blautia sp.]|nr:DUF3784 domain-containing protein [Blautia sp.]